MPDDNVPGSSVPAKTGKPPLAHKSAEDTTLEEKLGGFDKIEYYVPKLESLFVSGFKIFLVLLLAIFILKLIFWINTEDNGIIVQPFETSGIGERLDGYSVALLLSSELQRIQEIDAKATEFALITGDYKYQESNQSEVSTHKTSSIRLGDETPPQLQSVSLLSEPRKTSDFSFLSQKSESLESKITGMGTLAMSGAQFSPGNLLLIFKEIIGKSPSPIKGSIQRYNSTIIIVATLDDHKYDQVFTWDVRKNIAGDNGSLNEQIPSMIRELSFHIASDLGRRWQPGIYYPESWQALKNLTQAQEAYLIYNRTLNISYLDLASDQALVAAHSEHDYEKPVDMLSEIAVFYLENDECNQAERIFRNLTYIQPFKGAMGLGAVYRREGRYEEAVTEFDEAIKINSKAIDAWNSKGNALTNQGKYDEAITAYDEAIRLGPKYVATWYNKGITLANQGKYDEAIMAYDMAISLDPKLAYAWNSKGIALTNLDKYDEAIMAYDEAIRLDPNNADAWNSKGNALTNQGKYDEAITAYDMAIMLNPKDAWTWSNKGIALYSQGKYHEAIKAYDTAIRLDPNLSAAWNSKGIALYSQGKYDEAIKAYDTAIRLDPNNADAWNSKGNALYTQQKYEVAIQAYDEAIRLDPNLSAAWSNKGSALSLQGNKYDEAIKAYDTAIRLDPKDTWTWNSKGIALTNLDKYDEAIMAYDEAIRLDPNNAWTWNNKGNALYSQGKYDEAIKAYDTAIRLDPNNADAWNSKGNALYSQGKYDEADAAFAKAHELWNKS